ncbi:hypothetical protein BDR22DRAFT_889416 [Usnea florida]
MTKPTDDSVLLAGQVETRIVKGALVDFGPGANILSMQHPADYSAIHISCHKPHRNAEDMMALMFGFFTETVGFPRIHIITEPDACPVTAHVQVEDPSFAARIKRKFDTHLRKFPQTLITVEIVAVDISFEVRAKSLYTISVPDTMSVRRQLLKDRLARLRIDRSTPPISECAVCFTETDDPFHTACGHLYCRTCITTQCNSITHKVDIPLRCLGDMGKCQRIFLLPELKSVLQQQQQQPATAADEEERKSAFTSLLTTAYTIHLRAIGTIQECPASTCRHLYRTSTSGLVLPCFNCGLPVCTTCQAPSHAGVTCAVYQKGATKAGLGEGVLCGGRIRKCPGCRNLVEKKGGCERVVCFCGVVWYWDYGGL